MDTAALTENTLLLGIDGGATKCRARLCAWSGRRLAEAVAGPANIRLDLEAGIAAVLDATRQCLGEAGLSASDLPRVSACLALAGATEPAARAAAQGNDWPFGCTLIVSDAEAACVGAHRGGDGGIIIAGTGSIGWAKIGSRQYRIGGWGLPASDEGSGAWLGRELLRRVLWAYDGRAEWSELLCEAFAKFENDPHAIVRWTSAARPHEFGALAPLVVTASERGDTAATELMQAAAFHIDALALRLIEVGVQRLCLLGGLAAALTPQVSEMTRAHLVTAAGDALDGALRLARAAATAARDTRVA